MSRQLASAIKGIVGYGIGMVTAVVLLAAVLSLCGCSTANATGEEYSVEATVVSAEWGSYITFIHSSKVPVPVTHYTYSTVFELADTAELPSGERTFKSGSATIWRQCDGHDGDRVTVTIDSSGFVSTVEF